MNALEMSHGRSSQFPRLIILYEPILFNPEFLVSMIDLEKYCIPCNLSLIQYTVIRVHHIKKRERYSLSYLYCIMLSS